LTGSIGRGEHDDWSDLDLHVAIFDEHLAAFWADRERLYQRIGQPVLVQPAACPMCSMRIRNGPS
jgi:predicted nucleotidyltransferase